MVDFSDDGRFHGWAGGDGDPRPSAAVARKAVMRRPLPLLAVSLLLGCIVGPAPKPVSPLEATQYQEAGARFAQVRLGMTQRQVLDLLGPPTGTHGWRTGKAWIPFNPGIDVGRYRYHWRARGRVTFAVGIENGFQGKVILVEPDPNEIGDE